MSAARRLVAAALLAQIKRAGVPSVERDPLFWKAVVWTSNR